MSNLQKHKARFRKRREIGPVYAGGPVAVTPDGNRLVTCVGDETKLFSLEDGKEVCQFSTDSESHSLCITPSSTHLISFTTTYSLHVYKLPTDSQQSSTIVRPILTIPRAHNAPVHVCKVDPTSTYLASGSADGVVKVWDISTGRVTHVLPGHGGAVSALSFNYPTQRLSTVTAHVGMQLVTASTDARLRVFDLSSSSNTSPAVLEGHHSVPRGLDFTADGRYLLSGGRDSIVLLWDMMPKASNTQQNSPRKKKRTAAPTLVKTLPVLERIEALAFLWEDGQNDGEETNMQFYTAGESGLIKLWDAKTGSKVADLSDGDDRRSTEREIVDAFFLRSSSTIMSIHVDQNIYFHSVRDRRLSRQLIGFNNEVADVCFLSPSGTDSHLAVAANSSSIRIYSTAGNDERLLTGHDGPVLCLDHSAEGKLFASGSKDKTARVWASNAETGSWGCLAICEGHDASVGAVAMSQQQSSDSDSRLMFMFTGSQDASIKMWDLSSISSQHDGVAPPERCRSLTTLKAHEQEINSLDIALGNRLLASGSQDRTAKIYAVRASLGGSGALSGEAKLLGTCKGHKRGVWTVKFGLDANVLATGSGDKTIKLWNLNDFSCVKTFEGHDNSVLRVLFLRNRSELVSSSSDGMVKLWNTHDGQCISSMDNHTDKVWALTVTSDGNTIVSGAADSLITFWEDCSEEISYEEEQKRGEAVLKGQAFENYLHLHDYRNAFLLAIRTNQPDWLLKLLKKVDDALVPSSVPGESLQSTLSAGQGFSVSTNDILRELSLYDLGCLIRHLLSWVSKAGMATTTQTVLNGILKQRHPESILKAIAAADGDLSAFSANDMDVDMDRSASSQMKEGLDKINTTLIVNTERHCARMERLLEQSYVIDYVLHDMDSSL